jgi:hypothetical protein
MKRTHATPATVGDLSMLSGWAKLQSNEQAIMTEQTQAIAAALHGVSQAKITVGEHLSKVRDVLEPKRIFTKYLKTIFHMSKATAYRYIDLYAAAKTVLPAPVLEAAMMRPDDVFTVKSLKAAPRPPRTTNVVKINEYLDGLQHQKGPRLVAERKSADEIQKALFHSASLLLSKLPKTKKLAVLASVTAYLLSEIGAEEMSIKPVAIPESFRIQRGRPRKVA